MRRTIRADRDAYITNRIIKNVSKTTSNVGNAGSLDLYKLYGIATTSSVEVSRALIHFDSSPLLPLITSGELNPNDPTFSATLSLKDVYGGQPTPSNFTLTVHPLSKSFAEGIGRDVVLYTDYDVCNYLSSSQNNTWISPGCNNAGDDSGPCDYLSASKGVTLWTSQRFTKGDENLSVKVTKALSASLVGEIPDSGFRVSFSPSEENDSTSYFVKRFASRNAYNETYHPTIDISYDDSIQDDSQNLLFDVTSSLFLFNTRNGIPRNLQSGSTSITGNNSLLLRLVTEISGGWASFEYTGSQHTTNIGVYSATFALPSNNTTIATKIRQSGSVSFYPIWSSFDKSVSYLTGAAVTVRTNDSSNSVGIKPSYIINAYNIPEQFNSGSGDFLARVHIFDPTLNHFTLTRRLVEAPGVVVRDAHYRLRNIDDNKIVYGFDTITNSTRLSSDSRGMWFKFDTESLLPGRYVFDVLLTNGITRSVYENVSKVFRVL